jgi:hypothetical protein
MNGPKPDSFPALRMVILNAFDRCEDASGPEGSAYVQLMEDMARECDARAARYRDKLRESLLKHFPDFYIHATGGGCDALRRELPTGGHILITDPEASAPTESSRWLVVGLYDADGERVLEVITVDRFQRSDLGMAQKVVRRWIEGAQSCKTEEDT